MEATFSPTSSSLQSSVRPRRDRIQRLIDHADESLQLLATFDEFSASTAETQCEISLPHDPQDQLPACSNFYSMDTIDTKVASTPSGTIHTVDPMIHDGLASYDVDRSVRGDMLHIKAHFPDQSVEYIDIDPNSATIREIKHAFCAKRNTESAFSFSVDHAQVMFDGNLVQDDWLVADCGAHFNGAIHIVKKSSYQIGFNDRVTSQHDSSLASASPTSIHASHVGESASSSRSIPASVGEALSWRIRPEETFFANMLADFHETAPDAEDQKILCDKLLCGYIDALDAQIKRLKVKQGRVNCDASWKPTLSIRSSQESLNIKPIQFADEITQLRDERNTWKLLYQLRQADMTLESMDSISTKISMIDLDLGSAIHFGMTEDEAVELLESHNTTFRVLRAVKDWLEDLAAEEELTNLERRKGIAPRTLRSLKKGTYLGLPYSKTDSQTVYLDPDATLRVGDADYLDDDLEDEASLMKCLWKCVRSGQLERAIDICTERGQAWRAASLSGGTPVGASIERDASISRWGNPFRPLWKSICWRFSNLETPGKMVKSNSKIALSYEKAIYAALCGNAHTLIQSPACDSWEDHCWALVQAITESQVDKILLELCKVKLQSSNMLVGNTKRHMAIFTDLIDKTKDFEKYEKNIDFLFNDLMECNHERVRTQANEPFRRVQARLVSNKIGSIMAETLRAIVLGHDAEEYDWNLHLGDDKPIPADTVPVQFLRFAAHFVLFMGFTQQLEGHFKAGHMIVKMYIRHLTKHAQLHLLPIYISPLPDEALVELYCQILLQIDTHAEMESCIRRMLQYLSMNNVSDIVFVTVERKLHNLFCAIHSNASVTDIDMQLKERANDGVTTLDRQRVKVLEVLFIYQQHRAQALIQMNLLAREFILEKNFAAFQELFRTYDRDDSIGIIQMHRNEQLLSQKETKRHDQPNDYLDRCIREHLCWRSLAQLSETFHSWRSILTRSASSSPYHQEKVFVTELMYHVSRAITSFIDAVHFENGWMCHCLLPDEADKQRKIRQHCLPMVVFDFHFLLHESSRAILRLEHYPMESRCQLARPLAEKALEIADFVADEHHQVCDAFTPEQCQRLVKCFRSSASQLMFMEIP
ncbi:unnamed protein product [Albugo candida]|uniref:Nuclear pore complex protein n=1 Tax=Albugo candida TaxID=65357 RepID=A0A024FZI1_9STRA|nr:unnamed protein product [Albugo candida]|eukprot:CCI39822.1 unnamed protein product [Albugo candida]